MTQNSVAYGKSDNWCKQAPSPATVPVPDWLEHASWTRQIIGPIPLLGHTYDLEIRNLVAVSHG